MKLKNNFFYKKQLQKAFPSPLGGQECLPGGYLAEGLGSRLPHWTWTRSVPPFLLRSSWPRGPSGRIGIRWPRPPETTEALKSLRALYPELYGPGPSPTGVQAREAGFLLC